MSKAGRIAFFMEWLTEVQRLRFPTDAGIREQLARTDVNIRKVSSFRDALRFLVWALAEFAPDGNTLYATQANMAEGYGCSRKTVRRYLRAAVICGLLSIEAEGNSFTGESTEYHIRDFWTEQEEPLTVGQVFSDLPPSLRPSEPPY